MSSGTAVLHAIVRGLGIGKDDLVLTTSFSFISTSNSLLFEGAAPVFVDIDPNTYNLTPASVEAAYLALPEPQRARVKGLAYVDVFGVPADGMGFEALGKKYGWHIIDDSAEALGAAQGGRKCGSFGDAGLFAFYPNKQITTGEGGVLVTNNSQLADMSRSLRNQGRDVGAGWLQHARLGYNYRISDINCALGIAQMERLTEIIQKRKRVKALYDMHLLELVQQGHLVLQQTLPGCDISPFVYVVRLGSQYNKTHREGLLAHLREFGIGCSNYFTPIHMQPHYMDLGWQYGALPVTERVSERTVALPFFNNLSEEEVVYVTRVIHQYFARL